MFDDFKFTGKTLILTYTYNASIAHIATHYRHYISHTTVVHVRGSLSEGSDHYSRNDTVKWDICYRHG